MQSIPMARQMLPPPMARRMQSSPQTRLQQQTRSAPHSNGDTKQGDDAMQE